MNRLSVHLCLAALSLSLSLSACAHHELAGGEYSAAAPDNSYDEVYIAELEDDSVSVSESVPAPEAVAVAQPRAERQTAKRDSLDMDVGRASVVSEAGVVPVLSAASTASKASGKAAQVAATPSSSRREMVLGGAIATPKVAETRSYGVEAMVDAPPAPPQDVDGQMAAVSGSEQYTDHGVNPFTMVEQDALSTFSIDVDTASYTISRRKLQEGSLPPAAAVRVEEYINYFNYGYTPPQNGPFAVHMEAMPDPFRAGHHVLRVGVQGKEVSREERSPLHLTFLVDVSGSMSSWDKLPLAQQSLHMLVDNLREDDTVGLCTYAGRVARVLEPTSAGNKRKIHDAISSLNSSGSTAMSAGIDLAYEMAWQAFEKGHENRVIILSDGDANVGRTSQDDMLAQIKGYADKGVTVSTIGFGMGNYKDTLMEQLSNKGDGNNFYIDDAQQAQRVFVEDIGGTLVTIARDVKIQVEFNPESVSAYRLIGYENRDIADKDFRNDRVDAGEVGAGHNVTALYEVVLRKGYDRELATVRLRWEKPGADSEATERAFTFSHESLKEAPYLASRALRVAYSAGTFAEILRGSPQAAEISLADLANFAEKAARSGEADDKELIDLIRTADRLSGASVALF